MALAKIWYMNYTQPSNPKEKKRIESRIKLIVSTILERCRKEKFQNRLVIPLDFYEQRATFYTGVSQSFIHEINKEHLEISNSLLKSNFTEARDIINNCLLEYYNASQTPTYMDILMKIGNQLRITNEIQLIKCMTEMDYTFAKLKNNNLCLIMEKPEIRFDRYFYLKKMKKHRSDNSPIYFIDAICIGNGGKFVTLQPDLQSEGVLFYMVSKFGFENTIYWYQPKPEDYLKWLVDVIIPILKSSSAVILDGSNPLNEICDIKLSRYDSKADMIAWLQRNKIPCSETMHKAELYELIEKSSVKSKQYLCEKILKVHGHDVLWLPKHYHDLSLTSFIHRDINDAKMQMKQWSTLSLQGVLKLICENFDGEKLVEYDSILENTEHKTMSIDTKIESALDKYDIDSTAIYNPNNCCCQFTLEENELVQKNKT